MTAAKVTERIKIGVAVYLRTFEKLTSEAIISDFQNRWPNLSISATKRSGGVIDFHVNDSTLTAEFRALQVPDAVTFEALRATRHWGTAESELGMHKAHIAIAGLADRDTSVRLACELTKCVSSVLSVSDAVGLCWLNGPVLNTKLEFIGVASEVFTAGMLPCFLWVAGRFNPEARMIHTTGMDQFGHPNLLLAEQSTPANIEYLFDLVHYLLSSGNELLEGETVDGPDGVLTVKSIQGTSTKKRGVLLLPAQIN